MALGVDLDAEIMIAEFRGLRVYDTPDRAVWDMIVTVGCCLSAPACLGLKQFPVLPLPRLNQASVFPVVPPPLLLVYLLPTGTGVHARVSYS